MEFYGYWKKECCVCGKLYERNVKPIINIFTCCGRSHHWDKVIE